MSSPITPMARNGIETSQLRSDLKGKLIRNNEAIEVNAKKNSSRQDNYWENYDSIEADFNVDSVLRVMRHQEALLNID